MVEEEEGESRGLGRLAGPVAPDDEEEIRAGAGRTKGCTGDEGRVV